MCTWTLVDPLAPCHYGISVLSPPPFCSLQRDATCKYIHRCAAKWALCPFLVCGCMFLVVCLGGWIGNGRGVSFNIYICVCVCVYICMYIFQMDMFVGER